MAGLEAEARVAEAVAGKREVRVEAAAQAEGDRRVAPAGAAAVAGRVVLVAVVVDRAGAAAVVAGPVVPVVAVARAAAVQAAVAVRRAAVGVVVDVPAVRVAAAVAPEADRAVADKGAAVVAVVGWGEAKVAKVGAVREADRADPAVAEAVVGSAEVSSLQWRVPAFNGEFSSIANQRPRSEPERGRFAIGTLRPRQRFKPGPGSRILERPLIGSSIARCPSPWGGTSMSIRPNESESPKRGRQARLKPEHADLYPGLTPGAWMPVESLLRHITDLIHQDRTKAKAITGTRLLHQAHFEFRGGSTRPDGLPDRASRLSDAGLEPDQLETTSGRSGESVPRRGKENPNR